MSQPGAAPLPGEEGMEAKVAELWAQVTPDIQGSPELQRFCTDACLRRFLRARRLDVGKAAIKLRATLKWRKAYAPEAIVWADVEEDGKTGKLFVVDGVTDRAGRPVVVMRPRHENTKAADGQIRNLVYTLERACAKADALGVEKMTVLIDFEGYSMFNAPPMQTSKATLHILQGHYPERLGAAVCFHPPMLFRAAWQVLSPLMDPVTYAKVSFCPDNAKGQALMNELFNVDQLEECLGGSQPPHFDLQAYSSARRAEEAAKAPPAANGTATEAVAVAPA